MASVWAKLLSGSPHSKNVHFQVNGSFGDWESLDWQRIIEVAKVPAESLRLDTIDYAISDKTEVLLAWDKGEGDTDPHVFLPLNGRGHLSFNEVGGLRNTVGEGKTGDVLICAYRTAESPNPSHFTLALDFSKQGA